MSACRLILECRQSPGDVEILTAAVEDLHRPNLGLFITDVRTTVDGYWKTSVHHAKIRLRSDGEVRKAHYPLIQERNHWPCQLIHGWINTLQFHFIWWSGYKK